MMKNKFAFEKRKLNKANNKKRFLTNEIEPLIEFHISKKINSSTESLEIEQLIENTHLLIQNKYISENRLKTWALNHLHKFEKNLSDVYKFEAATFFTNLGDISETNNRSLDHLIKVSQLASWHQHQTRMIRREKNLGSNHELMAQILISASVNGGLCFTEGLTALCDSLNMLKKPIILHENTYWIELVIESNHFPFNDYKDENKITNRRWEIDSYTLLIINNYLNRKTNSTRKTSSKGVWRLINDYLQKVSNSEGCDISEIKNQKDFNDASVGLLESNNKNYISEYLLNYARGKILSSSLCNAIFYPLITKKIHTDPEKHELITKILEDNPNTETHLPARKKSKKGGLDDSINIYSILKSKYPNKNKVPKNKYILRLKKYKENVSVAKRIAIDWFIALLEIRDVVPSTIERYSSTFLKPWLNETYNKDIDNMDSSDFELIYQNMIESKVKINGKINTEEQDYLRRKITQFHTFGVNNLGFPSINFSVNCQIKQQTVRAMFVSEECFALMIHNLHTRSSLHKDKIWLYTSILFVAYRTGIRIGELEKLKFRDIELSHKLWYQTRTVEFTDELWFQIRPNIKGNNKSPSAIRRVPVGILLTKHEKEYLLTFLKNKYNLSGKNRNALVFSHFMSPTLPFSNSQLSECIYNHLNAYLKLPVKFHDLRHSALTRLHAIQENSTKLIKLLSNYSDEEVIKIQSFLNHESENSIWQIAGLAGHSSPEQTFTSYLHSTDQLLSSSLDKTMVLDKELIIKLSGHTQNKITKLFNENQWLDNEIKIEKLKPFLKKQLSRFSKTVSEYLGENLIDPPDMNFKLISNSKNPSVTQVVLSRFKIGMTAWDLSLEFGIDETTIERWLINSVYFSLLRTTKNKPKLFSRNDKGLHLAPSPPQNSYEIQQSEKIIDKLLVEYSENDIATEYAISTFLENIKKSEKIVTLSCHIDLLVILNLLIKLVNKKHIELEFLPLKRKKYKKKRKTRTAIPPIKEQIKYWKEHLVEGIPFKRSKKNITTNNTCPYGQVKLIVRNPNNGLKSNALLFALHLTAINLFNEENDYRLNSYLLDHIYPLEVQQSLS